jgi:pyrimidine deaminase RibD-like protein
MAMIDYKKILKIKGLKYIVATVIFVVVIVFVDENNLLVTMRLHRQVNRLHAEECALREAIVQDSINAANIKDNLDAIEHYGRENYYMKRSDEDIFVISD